MLNDRTEIQFQYFTNSHERVETGIPQFAFNQTDGRMVKASFLREDVHGQTLSLALRSKDPGDVRRDRISKLCIHALSWIQKKVLTKHVTVVRSSSVMFTRRLGPQPDAARCSGGHSCPDILEMSCGDYAIIGTDITDQATTSLPPGSGCGPQERVVQIPRRVLVLARSDIPAAL